MQVFTCILCTLLVFLVSGCWFFGGFYLNFWKSMSIPFEVLEKLSIPVTEHKSGKEHFEMLKVMGRVEGGTPWAHCYTFNLISNRWAWALVPTKLVELGNALVWGGSIRGNPVSRRPPGTVTLNNSVEYLLTNTYLALTSRAREGWEKQKHKMALKQQAIATTLCEELKQATAYISHKVPLIVALGHTQNSWENCCLKSDKHLFSSKNINTRSREKVVRIYLIE